MISRKLRATPAQGGGTAAHWATEDQDKQQEMSSPRLEMRKFLGTTYVREVSLRPAE